MVFKVICPKCGWPSPVDSGGLIQPHRVSKDAVGRVETDDGAWRRVEVTISYVCDGHEAMIDAHDLVAVRGKE